MPRDHTSRPPIGSPRQIDLLRQVLDIADGAAAPGAAADDATERLARICTLLRDEVPAYDWVGFYLLDPARPRRLVPGPYSGEPLEMEPLPFGRGACGRAASIRDAFVNPDVSAVPADQACHPDMRSEIAVPLLHDDQVVGGLNVDSRVPSAFDRSDVVFLRRVGEAAAPLAAHHLRDR